MGLRDSIRSDAISLFCNNTEFAETIEYNFRNGGSRSFSAVITREPPEVYNAAGEVVMPKYLITFPGDCESGVEPKDIDTGGDKIRIIRDFNGLATDTLRVGVVVAQDMGMVTVAVM